MKFTEQSEQYTVEARIMGLLDKVDNIDEEKPAKAKVAKAVAKAKPKAAKAVAKANPAKPTKSAKVAKAAKAKKKPKEEKLRPTGLPEGYELAGAMPRYIGWLINVAWNFGVLIGTISIFMFGDPDMTIPFLLAGVMIIANWLVIPIWTGRNIGEFVSRTKYINSAGNKPNFLHAILNNSLGYMFLIGFIFIAVNFQNASNSTGMTYIGVGAVFIVLWIVNFFFKKNSDYSQGLFDLAFSSYLVKHVASGDETGWLARFESLGDFGDKWAQRSAERQEKSKLKAEEKAASKAAEAEESEEESSESEEESED